MIDVSVCISVHNTSALLPRCLDSVCAQTLKSLEIVLVNNGSTDNSEAIMYEYKEKHPERTFVIVRQEDKGLAQGRQTGVNNASGRYIAFLDADDYVDARAYEKMYSAAQENHADIVEIQTRREGKVISSSMIGLQNSKDIFRKCLSGECNTPTMLWLRLYKRELFEKPVFPNLYTNNEDNFAYLCLLYKADSIYYLNEVLHEYTTDNENAYMNVLEQKQHATKRYKARQVVLNCVTHIENFVGQDIIREQYNSDFNNYKARVALVFVYTDFDGISYKEKVEKASAAIGVSARELPSFVRNNVGRNTPTLKLIHIFGFKPLYIAYKILNHKLQ